MDARTKWDQLDKSSQQKLIDKYRGIHTDHDWWEGVCEQFKEKCEGLGIRVDKVYFSGFWSQGDGACFEGNVSDWGKFLKACGLGVPPNLNDYGISLSWKHSGRYYHEQSVSYSDDLYIDNPFDEEDDGLRHAAWAATYGADGPFVSHFDTMTDFIRSLMTQLYSDLESKYEYLSGDEQVSAYILEYQEDEIDYLLETNTEIS